MAQFNGDDLGPVTQVAEAPATFRRVAVGDLLPCPWNPRKNIPPAAIERLAKSILSAGLLQPLVVRPHPKHRGKYEILAGERRHLALQAAGIQEAECNVRDLDDQAAIEITVVENMMREDLHPLEEAAGFQSLLDKGWDVASIASRFKHSPNWVARRVALNRLIPGWRKRYLDEEDGVSGVPLGVIEGVARLSEEQQKDLLEQGKHGPMWWMNDVKAFNEHLTRTMLRVLDAANWKLDDPTLLPKAGACCSCPKRSSQAAYLFDDLTEGKKGGRDRCLDAACFQEKSKRALAAKIAAVEAEHGACLLVDGGRDYDRRTTIKQSTGREVVSDYEVNKAKQGDKGARPAIYITDSGVSGVRWVKLQAWASGSGSKKREKGADGKPKPLSLPQRRLQLGLRRKAWVTDQVRETLQKIECKPAKGQEVTAYLLPPFDNHFEQLTALALCFGTMFSHRSIGGTGPTAILGKQVIGDGWDGFKAISDGDDGKGFVIIDALYRDIFPVMASRLRYFKTESVEAHYQEALQVCELLGLDPEELHKQAEEEIPEPKSWAKLAAAEPEKKAKKSQKQSEKADPGKPAKGGKARKTKAK